MANRPRGHAILSDWKIRLLGLSIGSGFGFVAVAAVREAPGATNTDRALALATLAAGAVLGWIFAIRALRPGWRAAVQVAASVSILAVPAGSYLVALQAAFASGGDLSTALASALIWGTVGLIFLGIPMLLAVLVASLAWVALVRVLAHLLQFER